MDIFKAYANYYNLLYGDKDYQSEVDYVDSLIKKFSNKNVKHLLDLGCGTGGHALRFASKGYEVEGVDLSEEMIKIAKANSNGIKSINFQIGDARTFSLGKKIDAITSLFHVINYMTTNDDLQRMFERVSYHLDQDGLFIFDCWYGPAVLSLRPEVRFKKIENDNVRIIRVAEPQVCANENLIDVNYEIILIDKKNKTAQTLKETHRVRYLFKPEIELLFKNNGFEMLYCAEFLSNKTPGFDTWGVCFVAKKI